MKDMESHNKILVLDIGNGFMLVCEIDFSVAQCLNVGDTVHPDGTGFSFTIVGKHISLVEGKYVVTLNVVEYETAWEKVKRFFGVKSYSYWDYKKIYGTT
jgi:hypothetical protein